jgi:hypothetical protein
VAADRVGGAAVAGLVTSDEVSALAGSLVSDQLVVMPVRHHSPACALQVRAAIADLSPSAVLIEGPRGMTSLIPLLAHPQAVLPLAIYTYAVRTTRAQAQRWSAYYPFCDYSPEYVAIAEAAAQGIPTSFIDLEFAEQAVLDADRAVAAADEDGSAPLPPAGGSLLEEGHYRHSRRLQALAERLGCRDHEDLWEHLFEADAETTSRREHVDRVTAYCLLARRDHTEAELTADGTTEREAEMAWHVKAALAAREADAGPVLVVVGGFHAVALPGLLAAPPPRPSVSMAGVTADSAIIRYTFERLERLNGYASGMTSPAWHQHLWNLMSDGTPAPRATAALTALLDVTAELRRRHHMPVPTPAVAAAYEQTLRLAELRDRPAPLRSDLLDAVTSCFVKGEVDVEGALVRAAARHVLTGSAVGTVPPGAGTPPLVVDTLDRLRRARLDLDGLERRVTALDIYRRPEHRASSRMLHGLALLAVPFAHRVAGPDFAAGVGLDRLQEKWEYLWSPATEGSLVEASAYGPTLPEAVLARFEEHLAAQRDSGARRDARQATGLLAQACVLGLHGQASAILQLVAEAIATDAAFDGLVGATVQLALLSESREPLEAQHLTRLPDVLRATYERAIYLGRELTGAQCEPAAAAQALVSLRELLVGVAGESLDADLYWQMVERLRDGHDRALVRGAAAGLCYSAGRLDSAGLAQAVAGHLAGTSSPADAVGFLRGLLVTARESAWQELPLLERVDEQLAGWDADTFIAHLPELRLAFAGMTPSETDRIATLVGKLHGIGDLGSLLTRDTDDESVRTHLVVSAAAVGLLERDGLADWAGDA